MNLDHQCYKLNITKLNTTYQGVFWSHEEQIQLKVGWYARSTLSRANRGVGGNGNRNSESSLRNEIRNNDHSYHLP